MRFLTRRKLKIHNFVLIGIIFIFTVLLVSCSDLKKDKIKDQEMSKVGEIRYYTCGMHPSVRVSSQNYDRGNINCPICNMSLTPVYLEESVKEKTETKKILFYRNPMNPSITSKFAAKDQMGMDYIPVYEDVGKEADYYGCGMQGAEHVYMIQGNENMICPMCDMPLKKLSKDEADKLRGVAGRVKIKQSELDLAGVKSSRLAKRHLFKEIRTVGKVAYDPQLAIAQEEFVSALNSLDKVKQGGIPEIIDRTTSFVESVKRKLMLLGLSLDQIKEIEIKREVEKGFVLPGEKMWIYGEVYEYELGWIKSGQEIRVTTSSIPGEEFLGVILSINPALNPKTRSVTFRAQVDNPGLKLKSQMYVDVTVMSMYISAEEEDLVLAIPKSAVLDTGTRKIAWIDLGEGQYEGRLIEVGPQAISEVDGEALKFYPVLKGVKGGDLVVVSANFLIDSQSQLSGVTSSAYSGALEGENKNSDTGLHAH